MLLASCTAQPSRFELAKEACFLPNSPDAALGDGGRTLFIDHRGEDELDDLSTEKVLCLLAQLDAPESVVDHMFQTRAIDGIQENGWDGISARWTYHPDTGLAITLTVN